jgi:hypothetical protein
MGVNYLEVEMKRFLLVTLLLAIAVPARAVTPQESEAFGFKSAMSVCKAISRGARTVTEVAMSQNFTRSEMDFIEWLIQSNPNSPIQKAYYRGYNQGIEPCVDKLKLIQKR